MGPVAKQLLVLELLFLKNAKCGSKSETYGGRILLHHIKKIPHTENPAKFI
jgi:hypothetical protein